MSWTEDYYIDDIYGDDDTLDSNGEPLPVCAACNEVIPELEIYYTIQDKDYCQHCAQIGLAKLSPAEIDAWLTDPK
jgi:hypothetical protein